MLDLELDTNAYDECLRALNRQFQELTQQAKELQTRFMEQEHEGKMLPVLITVIEDKRYRSTAIRWSRAIPTRKDGKKHILAKAIPKGRDTHKYPASAFSFLEPELQAKVWHYEEMLSLLRYSLARNCLAHTHLVNTKKSLAKQVATFGGSVSLGSADAEALLS